MDTEDQYEILFFIYTHIFFRIKKYNDNFCIEITLKKQSEIGMG